MRLEKTIQEGQFKDGKLDGFGRVIYEDLSWYSGELKAGTKHGQGTLNLPDGTKKTEFWLDDGVNCNGRILPADRSKAPVLKSLPYANSTAPVDLGVKLV